MEQPINVTGLVFEGGGILGISHIGALSEALKYIDMAKIKYFAGTSVGSIIASLCACRISVNDLKCAINSIKFGKLLDDNFGIIRDLYKLFTKFGYYKGDNLEDKFGDILEKYVGNRDITLKQVRDLYGSYIIIPVTEMFKNHCKIKYFTPDDNPDEKLRTIVRYSSSYPFVFISKNNYTDGGILDNYPIKKLTQYIELKNILGFKFRENFILISRPKNLIDFATAIISGLRENNCRLDDEGKRTIVIDTGNYKSMDFRIRENDRKKLYNYGVESAKYFFQNQPFN